jgi:hypothetical protein
MACSPRTAAWTIAPVSEVERLSGTMTERLYWGSFLKGLVRIKTITSQARECCLHAFSVGFAELTQVLGLEDAKIFLKEVRALKKIDDFFKWLNEAK